METEMEVTEAANLVFVKMEKEEQDTGSDEVDALADIECKLEESEDERVVSLVYVEAIDTAPRGRKKQNHPPSQSHSSRVSNKSNRDDKIRGILASLPILKPVPATGKPSPVSTPAHPGVVQSTGVPQTKKTNNIKKEKIKFPRVLQLNTEFTFDDVLWLVQHDEGEEVDENFEIQVLSDDEFNESTSETVNDNDGEEEVDDEALLALLQQDDFCHIKESDNELIITIDNNGEVVNPPMKIINPVTIDSRSLMTAAKKTRRGRPKSASTERAVITEMISRKTHLEPKFITGSPEYFCVDCNKAFTTHFSFQRHQAVQHGIIDKNKAHFRCENCGKIFFCKDELNRHMIRIHNCPNAILHRCHICGRLFPSQYELARHRVKLHEPRTIPCDYCEKKFARHFILKEHKKRSHKAPTAAKCQTCNEMVLCSEIAMHMATEHPRRLQCRFCNKVFLKQVLLARHLKDEHGVSFCCGKCGRADFTSEEEFSRHTCS